MTCWLLSQLDAPSTLAVPCPLPPCLYPPLRRFGMAQKGTSVVLYSSPDIRQHQYTSITDW